VSSSAWLWRCVWVNRRTSTLSTNPALTWIRSSVWWPPKSSKGGFGSRCRLRSDPIRLQIYSARQEDRLRGGARFHHGDLPRRPRHRVRGSAVGEDDGQHPPDAPGRDESIFGVVGDHVQAGPQQFQT
jgi:hypothetical protein